MEGLLVGCHCIIQIVSFQKFRVPEDRRNEKAIQDAMNALPRVLKLLDEHLSDRKYMLGDKFTLADINLGIAVLGARGAQYDLSDYANISRWMEKLLERPSFKEGLEPPKK